MRDARVFADARLNKLSHEGDLTVSIAVILRDGLTGSEELAPPCVYRPVHLHFKAQLHLRWCGSPTPEPGVELASRQ